MIRRAIAIIDGEHYAPVVRAALEEVPELVVAAVLVGGTEKLRGGEDYGVPLSPDVEHALAAYAPDVVLDLSDEPVLDPVARFRLAGRVLAAGVPYEGPDFRLDPPVLHPFAVPSIAVVGTGKRVGKTAVTGTVARHCAAGRRVVVVAMGRGGPLEPEVILSPPSLDDLIALSRTGRHAASDHLETAVFAGVPTVGCRRCGGGLAGTVATSTVLAGAATAAGLSPDLVIFDGSGAAMPPIASEARVLVAAATQAESVLGGYLNPYRVLVSDLVLVTMAEEEAPHRRIADLLRELGRPDVRVVPVVLRPAPLEPIAGDRVAFFGTTSDPLARGRIERHLLEQYGAAGVAHVSGALAHRETLRDELARVDAETFVVELKAAAVDVVAEEAHTRGIRLVLARNDVEALSGHDLAAELDAVIERVMEPAGVGG